MNGDGKYINKGIVIEENICIPPLNETELIKQRNKIVDDYINAMENRNAQSKEKKNKSKKTKEEQEVNKNNVDGNDDNNNHIDDSPNEEEEEEEDAFLIAERAQRRDKVKSVKSNKGKRLKYPNCVIDHSTQQQSTREKYLGSDKAYLHNSTFDNYNTLTTMHTNDKWNNANAKANVNANNTNQTNNAYNISNTSNNHNEASLSYLYTKETSKKNLKYTFNHNDNKKRNKTAKTSNNKLNLGEHDCSAYIPKVNHRIKSVKPDTTYESKRKKAVYDGNDPKNPYSINWANKMLDKRYNMELELCWNGYSNGIPGIKLSQKKDQFNTISKRQLKENLDKMKKKNEDSSNTELKSEVIKQFITNTKNFYQIRKDIQEESPEKEFDANDNPIANPLPNQTNNHYNAYPNSNTDETLIQFPLIYKFFKQDH